MKQLLISSVILAVSFSGESIAACTGAPLTEVALTGLIEGNTVCASIPGGDEWREQHRITNNELWDYKKGPGDPVDPTEKVGTWSIGGGRMPSVTYTYTGGGNYTYLVYGSGLLGDPHSFCGSVEIHNAYFKSGETSCP